MVSWLLPVGMLATVALVSISTMFAYLAAAVWGLVFFPHAAAYISARTGTADGAGAHLGTPTWTLTIGGSSFGSDRARSGATLMA